MQIRVISGAKSSLWNSPHLGEGGGRGTPLHTKISVLVLDRKGEGIELIASARNNPLPKWHFVVWCILVILISKSRNLQHHLFGTGTHHLHLSCKAISYLRGRSGFFHFMLVAFPLKSYPLFSTHDMAHALYMCVTRTLQGSTKISIFQMKKLRLREVNWLTEILLQIWIRGPRICP